MSTAPNYSLSLKVLPRSTHRQRYPTKSLIFGRNLMKGERRECINCKIFLFVAFSVHRSHSFRDVVASSGDTDSCRVPHNSIPGNIPTESVRSMFCTFYAVQLYWQCNGLVVFRPVAADSGILLDDLLWPLYSNRRWWLVAWLVV